jgi:hypothetical protein
MAFAVLREKFSRGIEMGVFTNAGENIEDFASTWCRVLHSIRGEQRQLVMIGQINQALIGLLLAANEVALDFNVNIFASKGIR